MSFGTALRAWRTRRALSQEGLAHAAGTVARHVSRLETGRARPSAPMVRALAAALRVPPDGVTDLLLAAGHAPGPTTPPPAPGPALLDAVRRVLDAHDPTPAFALDAAWRVVAHNAAAGRLLAGLDPAALVGRHVLRIALHPGGLVRYAVDDAPWAAVLLARAAEQVAAVPSRPLADELARWAPTTAPGVADVGVPMRLRVPGGDLTLLAVGTRFAVPDDPAAAGLTIETLLPADAATRGALARAAASAVPAPVV